MSFYIHHPDLDGPPRLIPEHTLASYARQGWVLTDPEREPFANVTLAMPARNASAPEWKTYAVVAGMPYAEAMAATRDELADKYRPSTSASSPDKPAPKKRAARAPAATPPAPPTDAVTAADTPKES